MEFSTSFLQLQLFSPTLALAASALADGGVESRMFELTYVDAKEVADNFNRTNAVEGVMSLDLRDLEERASETKRE